ncbi:MAG: metal-dependent hydrolase [Chitinophagales bacterium]
MPSAFSHAVVAIAGSKIVRPNHSFWKLCLLAIFCAVIPDADVLGFKMGVPYESMFGHRGFTHSLFFSFLLGLFINLIFYRNLSLFSRKWWAYCLFFTAITFSHALLDAMTNGGRGCAFFAPFSAERYFFPFRPINVSPLGISRFFTQWGWRAFKSELIWVWIPSIVLVGIFQLQKMLKNRS